MKLFEEYKKCYIILDEVIPEDKIDDFKNWITSNNIKRYKVKDLKIGFQKIKYVGNLVELESMLNKWFINPELHTKIKCD